MLKKMYSKEYSSTYNVLWYRSFYHHVKESDYSITPEPFNIMLPMGKTKTLIGCIDLYTEVKI